MSHSNLKGTATTYLMAILITLQSVLVLASAHKSELPAVDYSIYIQTNNLVKQDASIYTKLIKPTPLDTSSYDCQYCTHCHGVTCIFLVSTIENTVIGQHVNSFASYLNIYTYFSGSPDNPPPIS